MKDQVILLRIGLDAEPLEGLRFRSAEWLFVASRELFERAGQIATIGPAGDVNHLPPSTGEGEMMGALCAQLSRGWKRNRAIRAALGRFESRIYDERDTI